MNILLAGSGQISDYEALSQKMLARYDLVIAVDGGAEHLIKLNIQPNCLIGDFDSISGQAKKQYAHVEHVDFPKEKDETDSELAFEYVNQFNPDLVHAIGFIGSRWDHSLANLMLLVRYGDLKILLIDENNTIQNCAKHHRVKRMDGHFLSLIALNDIKGLTIRGVKYPLEDKSIEWPSSLTISNEIIEAEAEIEYESGQMILMVTRD